LQQLFTAAAGAWQSMNRLRRQIIGRAPLSPAHTWIVRQSAAISLMSAGLTIDT
jgi:hypothetical protein